MPVATDHFITTNNIQLHYIRYAGEGPVLVLLHGLTANAHAFDGLVAAGLAPAYDIVCPDLRGRGLSDHPAFRYTLRDHAADILGLLDQLGIQKAILGGHSFGGLLSLYMAASYPDRVERLIIFDAAAQMNSKAAEMLGPTLARLDKKYASWDDYLQEIKTAPFNREEWSDDMLSYYQADVMETPNGGVTPRSTLANIVEVAINVANTPWTSVVERVMQPAILFNGMDVYTMGEPLLPQVRAEETVDLMRDCKYVPVDGNHHTMLYGDGARQIVKNIRSFVPPGA